MTMWTPTRLDGPRPKYLAIADALARDVEQGRLLPGHQLPTHRDLAARLGVTVGTITRAYAEARRRGLVYGEVGRGSFVGGAAPPKGGAPRPEVASGVVDLSINSPHPGPAEADVRDTLLEVASGNDLDALLRYQQTTGMQHHKVAAAEWLRGRGLDADPDCIALTGGAQHALLVAFSQIIRPGDVVVTETTAYPGIVALANLLHFRLVAVETDEHGVLPEALDSACQRHEPAAAYLTPSFHNPTATVMPEARREAIAALLSAHDVVLVEDDLHAFLAETPHAPLAPRVQGYYATSLSKGVAGGLRIGLLVAPVPAARLADAMWASTIMAAPLLAEVAARLMQRGAIARIEAARRAEVIERQRHAARILAPWIAPGASPAAQWLWLRLPRAWRPADFAAMAERRGIRVAPGDHFAVDNRVSRGVRVSLVNDSDPQIVADALEQLAAWIAEGPGDAVACC